ncbi:MAG: hypothetical protein KGD72_04460 [Candidatus Lokiarchaeota archaeon]|nr:hypothetical protein [Candidatus Lokiarchaeota archaeon]
MNILDDQFLLFKIDEENEDFIEIKVEDVPIHKLLHKFFIFIIVDPKEKSVWIWQGEKASIRKKFIATQRAPEIRDKYGVDFKISTIVEGSEPPEFKNLIGL